MATHIIGARKPANLAGGVPVAATPAVTVTPGTFAVVTNALAARMQGWQSNKSKTGNGTAYGVFNTYQKAAAYQSSNKLQLRTTIVQW